MKTEEKQVERGLKCRLTDGGEERDKVTPTVSLSESSKWIHHPLEQREREIVTF